MLIITMRKGITDSPPADAKSRTVSTALPTTETKSKPSTEKKEITTVPFVLFQPRRKLDYQNLTPDNKEKPLFITGELKASTTAPKYAGNRMAAMGPHTKISKDKKTEKNYYVFPHLYTEYFAMELLQRIGFNTPKCRFVAKTFDKRNYCTATREIKGHIPIRVFRNNLQEVIKTIPAYEKLERYSWRYQLDSKNQVVTQTSRQNLHHKSRYKVTGNLFCADMAALLFGDKDLQPKQENIALVREGNRFKAYLIDKDIDINNIGKSYQTLLDQLLKSKLGASVLKDDLFSNHTQEQQLAIVFELENFLKDTHAGIDNLFRKNGRLAKTFEKLTREQTDLLQMSFNLFCDKLKETAASFVTYYKQKFGKNCLEQFNQRETERRKIAATVAKEMQLPEEFQITILEDLRGPHYARYFPEITNNSQSYSMSEEGLLQLKNDLAQELFHDISGLQAIFEDHMTSYKGNRTGVIKTIRDLFADLTKDQVEGRSEIAIMLGCMLEERRIAQENHKTRLRWKSLSNLAYTLDNIVDEFCILTPAQKVACVKAYNDYMEPILLQRTAEKLTKLTQMVGSFI